MNIREEIRSRVDVLNKWRYEYYTLNSPTVPDAVYDTKFTELKKLEEDTRIIYADSPTQSVGYKCVESLAAVKHEIPLLSLDKTKETKDIIAFSDGHDLIATAKMDGLTTELMYLNGKLIRASTRGNGEVGEDVTHNAVCIQGVPLHIPVEDGIVRVVGETFITIADFNLVKASEDTEYKTPRNLAAGSLRQLDAEVCRKRRLSFIPFDIIEGYDPLTYSEVIHKLDAWGFTPIIARFAGRRAYDDIVDYIRKAAIDLGYPIDGVVFRYDDYQYGKTLGHTNHHFRHSIAFKFEDEETVSTVRDIEWSVGRSGVLTPVAVFDPIVIDGTDVSRASLHNAAMVKEMNIATGDSVSVIKANMIIPQITSVIEHNGVCSVPSVCPSCGMTLQFDGTNLICDNPKCPDKLVQTISYFCGKQGLDITGISDASVGKLVKYGILTKRSDIFHLIENRTEIMRAGFTSLWVDRMSEKVLERSHATKFSSFLCAFGIPGIGKSACESIVQLCVIPATFCDMIANEYNFSYLDGLGEAANDSIYEFFRDEYNRNDFMTAMKLMNFPTPDKVEKPLAGTSFVFTGQFPVPRTKMEEIVEERGAVVRGSVSSKTTYLVVGEAEENCPLKKKLDAAKKHGTKMLTYEDFVSMTR